MGGKLLSLLLTYSMLFTAGGCASSAAPDGAAAGAAGTAAAEIVILLSDGGVTVNGAAASSDPESAVYTGADIIYYESGRDETYGEGTEADAHTAEEAAAHTVVTITRPGTYRVSGALSLGQLAVDLGEGAETDGEAVVTLVLDGVDLTCTVAPAVIFYNVYECGSADPETASPTVDTAAAGANVVLADGSVNNIAGSYVARIYQEGTEKKLHKYDGAFYSRMSMNVTGEDAGDGVLNLTAENEGLDAELHLTINGGVIHITAQNDGINTNEDGVSVTTVNGGILTIDAGLGAEGDGIDSNGYLVVNGGSVVTVANGGSGDGGLDADLGIYLNGGAVYALGSRNDSAHTDSAQPFMELSFASALPAGSALTVEDADGNTLFDYTAHRAFSSVTISSPGLAYGETYAVYVNGVRQQYTGLGSGGGPGGMRDGTPPDGQGGTPPEGMMPPDGQGPGEDGAPPEDMTPPNGWTETPPEGSAPGQDAGGQPGRGGGRPGGRGQGDQSGGQPGSTAFTLTPDGRSFSGVSDEAEEASAAA